jgi:RimJ/RimL family protein N-acetyltransferase
MRITRWDPADITALSGCKAAWDAAQGIDDPDGARMTETVMRGWLRLGFSGDPAEAWFIPGDAPGSVIGWYRLSLPDLENLDRADLSIVIHPEHRRQGVGRAMLRHAAERAVTARRSVLGGEVRDGSAGDAFAAAVGAKTGMAATLRRLDLRAALPGKFALLGKEAAEAAAGYSLVRWIGPTPEEYRASFARLLNAYADAPRGEGHQAGEWDADRVQARHDPVAAAMGLRSYVMAVVEDASGELAGMTNVGVEPDDPHWGHQGLTAVTRPHRGHRLGLLLKTAMLDWLAEAEPAIERIDTGNASANDHMIAVNDALGFEVAEPAFHTVELTVADTLGRVSRRG